MICQSPCAKLPSWYWLQYPPCSIGNTSSFRVRLCHGKKKTGSLTFHTGCLTGILYNGLYIQVFYPSRVLYIQGFIHPGIIIYRVLYTQVFSQISEPSTVSISNSGLCDPSIQVTVWCLAKFAGFSLPILLMEEVLHHLGCIKPCK